MVDSELYFSSDYHFGLGGYDAFVSTFKEGWTYPENMGKGINSPSDDYFLIKNAKNDMFYFTSNRMGGRGKDDIYMARELTISQDIVSLVSSNSESLVGGEARLDELSVPRAVDLGKLTERTTVGTVDFRAARRVSYGEIIAEGTQVYFVQVAAFFNTRSDINSYRRLIKYGNIYKVFKRNSTKIKVGYYTDEAEARRVLEGVRNMGYKDAFLTRESLNTSELELAFSSVEEQFNTTEYSSEAPRTSNYKVRLASYENPIWFDVNKAKDLGNIEQWTKGSWTIFVLSGYSNLLNAKSAKIKAINRGFRDAAVVIDEGGILMPLKEN